MDKQNLKGLSRQELEDFIIKAGEKPFRAKQIWSWMYEKGINRFERMTNLSKDLRAKLDGIASISTLILARKSASSESDTQKFLWELEDSLQIESVYIPEGKRRTVCISTQVGCKLKCAFCATGKMGCRRNLEPHEIVDPPTRLLAQRTAARHLEIPVHGGVTLAFQRVRTEKQPGTVSPRRQTPRPIVAQQCRQDMVGIHRRQ